MGKARIGWEKRIDTAVLTASAQAAGLGPARLQSADLADAWNAGTDSAWLLADFGAPVELDGTMLAGVNLTAAATRRIRVSTADATGAAGDALDTGDGPAGVDPHYGLLVAPFAERVTGRYLRIDLADASLAELKAGRWWAGRLVAPARNFGFDWRRTVAEATARTETPGGQTHARRRPQRRGFALTFGFLTAAESETFAEALQRDVGLHDDLLVILDPDSASLGRDSLWGELAALDDVSNHRFNRFRFLLRVIERK